MRVFPKQLCDDFEILTWNKELITFFDSKGIIHREFVPTDQTITGAYYLEVLKRLMARIRRIRPEYRLCFRIMHRVTPHSLFVNFWLEIKSVCWIIRRIHVIWPRAISLYSQNWNWKNVFSMTFRPSKQKDFKFFKNFKFLKTISNSYAEKMQTKFKFKEFLSYIGVRHPLLHRKTLLYRLVALPYCCQRLFPTKRFQILYIWI